MMSVMFASPVVGKLMAGKRFDRSTREAVF
jgi:hypothetical protein